MRKTISLILAVVIVLTLSASAFAGDAFMPPLTQSITEQIKPNWMYSPESRAMLSIALLLDIVVQCGLLADDYTAGLKDSYLAWDPEHDVYYLTVNSDEHLLIIIYAPLYAEARCAISQPFEDDTFDEFAKGLYDISGGGYVLQNTEEAVQEALLNLLNFIFLA